MFMKYLNLILSGSLCGLAMCESAMGQDATTSFSLPRSVHAAATVTTLTIKAGTVIEPVIFDVSVRALAKAGPPQGTVNLLYGTNVFQSLSLSPETNSTHRAFAYSSGSYTLNQEPGGSELLFGRYAIKAEFVPGSNYLKSGSSKAFTLKKPVFKMLSDGVRIGTVAPGSGATIQSGQTANVLYTGFLTDSVVFDDSNYHGGAPLTFTLGANPAQVIPGFDAGTEGMQVGETRLIEIPPAEGYGANPPSGSGIPPNATLIFVVTLESIS